MNNDQNQQNQPSLSMPQVQGVQTPPNSNPASSTGGVQPTVALNAPTGGNMEQGVPKKKLSLAPGVLTEKFKSSSKQMKILFISLGAFLVLIVLLLLVALVKGPNNKTSVATPSPKPTEAASSPIPEVVLVNPSRYASDSAVLNLGTENDNLRKVMETADLRQPSLRIPSLDMDVKF